MMKKIASILIGALLVLTPVLAQDETFEFLERLGFADILLWLLTFAIVFGILTQVNLPQSKASRTIIGIVIAFLVLLAVPASLIAVLEAMSTGLVLVVLGILVVVVFLEIAGARHYKPIGKEGKIDKWQAVPFFAKHPYVVAAFLIIIAALIFMGAGGLELLGFETWPIPYVSPVGAFFFIVIVIAFLWLIAEKPREG